MARWRKLLEELRRNPRHVTFEELDTLLRRAGFERRSTKGSHYVYRKADKRLTVPYRKPHLLPVYVIQALRLLEEELEDDD